MADAKDEERWWHTASVIAWNYNAQRGTKLAAAQLHPYEAVRRVAKPRPAATTKLAWRGLKGSFKRRRLLKVPNVKPRRTQET